jgi:hypothetical protein
MIDEGQLFGRGVAFPPHINPEGRVAWSTGEQNVREAIRILLMTRPGERLFIPDGWMTFEARLRMAGQQGLTTIASRNSRI